jgi:ubiquinone/menaquinone biosynthesis C-methylase UbiE
LTSSRAVECDAGGPLANRVGKGLCPLCESDHLRAIPSIPGRVRCACGMVYSPDPPRVSQSRFFESEYSDAERLEKFYGHQRRKLFRGVIARVSRLVGRPERWLDIGCGPGALLLEASERGWECSGIDGSPRAVAMARQRGLRTFLGYFPEDMPASDVGYDAISIIHMLEEVQNPKSVLRECNKRLRSDGLLVLELKNFCFWVHAERFFRSRDGIWCPLDIRTYSLSTIARFLEVSGFELVAVVPSGLRGSRILTQLFSIGIAITRRAYSPSITVMARVGERNGTTLSA